MIVNNRFSRPARVLALRAMTDLTNAYPYPAADVARLADGCDGMIVEGPPHVVFVVGIGRVVQGRAKPGLGPCTRGLVVADQYPPDSGGRCPPG